MQNKVYKNLNNIIPEYQIPLRNPYHKAWGERAGRFNKEPQNADINGKNVRLNYRISNTIMEYLKFISE